MSKNKVALLMSGGVDSSYSAYLLQQRGFEVLGLYLKLHTKEEKHNIFIENCKKVSQNLNFEFKVIEAKEEFKKNVYDEFIKSYELGITPNPCAMCNPLIKFGLALNKAIELGCEFIATGHYARIATINGNKYIQEAVDKTKDQSYFLYAISQDAINRLIFPLGDMLKENVKKDAFKILPFLGNLQTYKESQEICFVEKDYIDILERHTEVHKVGNVVDTNGNVIGTHKGYMQYTIGKRKGFNIKGASEPHFAIQINPKKNEIVVGKKEELKVDIVHANNKTLGNVSGDYKVKVRYRSNPTDAFISINEGIIQAKLKESIYSVAKGQALVIYDDNVVIGGGTII